MRFHYICVHAYCSVPLLYLYNLLPAILPLIIRAFSFTAGFEVIELNICGYIITELSFLCMMAHSLINSFSDIVVVRQNWVANIIAMVVCVGFFVVINMCDGQKTVHLIIKEDKSHQNTNV